MAIKTYKFSYDMHEADAVFVVDTEVFTPEMAKSTLEFFDWDYNPLNDPIKEVLKKYAMKAIILATKYSYNATGVIGCFDSEEGFARVDGSLGLTLSSVTGYSFDEDKLQYYSY
jgi:hypothetical protein